MSGRATASRVIVGVATVCLVFLGFVANSVPAGATTLQTTVLSPVDGAISSNPDEPHHRAYGGDFSFDVHTSGQRRPVFARFRNSNGSLSLTVASVGRACGSQVFADGGDRIVLNVLINGAKVGTVTYAHLANFRYTAGSVPVGAQIGDVATVADGLRSSSCWSGPHVHVEPRNDFRYGCFFRQPLGAGVGASSPLGLVGGERASAVNVLCPSGAESADTGNPFGSFDTLTSPTPGQLSVTGWVADPNAPTSPTEAHVYVGGPAGTAGAEGHSLTANVNRPDVGAAYPGYGNSHGFDATLATSKVGSVQVCVYLINIGSGSNQLAGCRTVVVGDPNPFGNFDSVSAPAGGVVHVAGWAVDPNTPTTPIPIHVYVGGPAGTPGAEGHSVTANRSRPDVGRAHPGFGDAHGVDDNIQTSKVGNQQVCVYAINSGPGANAGMGCRSVFIPPKPDPVPNRPPVGEIVILGTDARRLNLFGYAIDPDTSAPIDVLVWIDGVGTWQVPAAEPWDGVEARVPGFGPRHAFLFSVDSLPPGDRTVCVVGLDSAGGARGDLGCRQISVK